MLRVLFVFLTCLVGFSCSSKPKEHVIDHAKVTQMHFVFSAASGSFEDNVLKLESVPVVVYFSDQPPKRVGHMSTKQFDKVFDDEKANLKTRPAMGSLSLLKGKKYPVEVVDLKAKNGEIIFGLRPTSAKVPEKFEEASLFLDLGVENWKAVAGNI